jgi:Skp family chaperone for outer membrane proteins
MTNLRFLQLGWVLFLATLAVLLGTAFQGPSEKIGVADVNRLMDESDFGKSIKTQLDAMRANREEILTFIDQNRVVTVEQANQIKDLTLKANRSKEDQARLDSTKADVVASNKKWTELATKPNLTPEERTLLQEYADRAQKANEIGSRMLNDFSSDINAWIEKQKAESGRRARTAVQNVAKQQGFTLVYDSVFTPFGANDLTDPALTQMNLDKPAG